MHFHNPKEQRMNEICDQLGDANPEQMEQLMEELGTIQDVKQLTYKTK